MLGLIFGVVEFVFGLFPDFDGGNWGTSIETGAETFGGHLRGAASWIDVQLVGSLLSMLAVAILVAGGVRLSTWIYEKFPFKGT